jgi:hypothetical protein
MKNFHLFSSSGRWRSDFSSLFSSSRYRLASCGQSLADLGKGPASVGNLLASVGQFWPVFGQYLFC